MRSVNFKLSLRIGAALISSFAIAACSEGEDSAERPRVDTILKNGNFYTLDNEHPRATAVAISEGVIVAVGDWDTLKGSIDDATEVVDLQEHVVLPGFHDMHVHPIFAGLLSQRCLIEQGSTLEMIQEGVKECVAKAEPGDWVVGGQWDASAIGGAPTHEALDAVASDNPVVLSDTSEHSIWVNAKALEIAGVTRDTPDPEGGIIERDANGEPTGVFRESAIGLVRSKVPQPAEEQLRSALSWSLEKMLSYGITDFTVAALGHSSTMEKELAVYDKMADEGVLKQRVRLCMSYVVSPQQTEDEHALRIIEDHASYDRDRLSVDCVKMFLDGVPTDSHTAAMLEPYEGSVPNRETGTDYGLLLVDQKTLDAAVTRFDAMGLGVKFHAAGDAAVRAGLNAIEAARKANGPGGPLHDVGHCTFVSEEDVPRAAPINATYEVSPYLWAPSPINDSITEAIGPERIKRVWPVKELVESGALVIPGSDWAVVPSVNPWIAVETLVTRERPGGSADSFGKDEAISLDQAIRLFTVNASRHTGDEDKLGRIKQGMLADMIVLDRDPFEIPATELHKVEVLKTIIDGEVVYAAQ
ncbi:MAG: amidohydrolase [Parvularculaceae bacterium]